MSETFETVIGLEIHVELLTEHKIFCSCRNIFGEMANTNKCPVCEGLPGAIPTLNIEVLKLATKAALILGCEINKNSRFDRKNYFYPDLPKGYQITQFYEPIGRNGVVTLSSGKEIRISDIHMEDDASKIIRENGEVFVDYNRCGVPLIEIVTAPDFRSSDEVTEFLEFIKRSFQQSNISDCRIEQGSMRADVNLSVHRIGEPLGVRTETKNMASFRAISKAIEAESKRQIEAIMDGKEVLQETRRWDENESRSFVMRAKENSYEYKYFPEPDLEVVLITDEYIENIRSQIPELPNRKMTRYQSDFGLTLYESDILTSDLTLIRFFEQATATNGLPKDNCNWILTHVLKIMGQKDLTVNPVSFAKLVKLVSDKVITNSSGREILVSLFDGDFDPQSYAEENGMLMNSSEDEIGDAVKYVLDLAENRKALGDYLSGNEKTFGFLMGKTMRHLGGKSDPAIVTEILKKALVAMKENSEK